jgi:hypothetical protein
MILRRLQGNEHKLNDRHAHRSSGADENARASESGCHFALPGFTDLTSCPARSARVSAGRGRAIRPFEVHLDTHVALLTRKRGLAGLSVKAGRLLG